MTKNKNQPQLQFKAFTEAVQISFHFSFYQRHTFLITDHIFKTSYLQLKQQLNICTIKTRNKGEEDGRNG